jgi:arsenate reductase
MEERGFDLHGHYAKSLREFLGKLHFDYLITVCNRAERSCPSFPGMGVRLSWPFVDPATFKGTEEERLAQFRKLRDDIEHFIREWLGERLSEDGRPRSG